MNKFLNVLQGVCYILIVIGAINWGLIGFFNFNLVEFIFQNSTLISRIIYDIIGISAIISIILTLKYTIDNRDYDTREY